ncbi:MAG: Fic family protein [Oscillospiraceae bacterium]|nr:Fic family protein [Oscillospiraceae bacterium]
MTVYDVSGTQEDCYPGTTVLINRLDIHEQEKLSLVEQKLVTGLAAQLQEEAVFEHVDFAYYKELHRSLFCDLYDWAGTVRRITISKKGFVFCRAEEIERIGVLRFTRLQQQDYLTGMSGDAFTDELAELYDDLNQLHPFREGNGRTLRLFMTLLVRNTGRELRFDHCDPDLLMIATIQAAQGSRDLLRQVFSEIVE